MDLAIDTETSKIPHHLPWKEGSFLTLVSFVTHNTKNSYIFNHQDCQSNTHKSLIEIIQNEINGADRIVGHNLLFELHWLTHLGIKFNHKLLYCTMIAEYLIRGQLFKKGDLTLDKLSEYYGITKKIDKVKLYWNSGYETDEIPLNILIPYCEQDAINALAIFQKQVPQINKLNLNKLIGLEMKTMSAIQQAEYNGMLLDKTKLQEYNNEYGERLSIIDTQLSNLLGIRNLDSSDQLSAGLFGGTIKEEGYEPGKRAGTTRKTTIDIPIGGIGFTPAPRSETKKEGVYSTGIDIIHQLKPKTKEQKQVKELLVERSRTAQLKSTYFSGLQNKIEKDGRVHHSLNQTVTKTTRLSCSKPKCLGL